MANTLIVVIVFISAPLGTGPTQRGPVSVIVDFLGKKACQANVIWVSLRAQRDLRHQPNASSGAIRESTAQGGQREPEARSALQLCTSMKCGSSSRYPRTGPSGTSDEILRSGPSLGGIQDFT